MRKPGKEVSRKDCLLAGIASEEVEKRKRKSPGRAGD